MAEHPDMVFSPVAYLADCGHLSDAEHGRYFLMLQHMWLAPNRRFPNDDAWLARKFRRSVEDVVQQLRPLLAEFFQTDGNWLRHKRLDRDWDRLAKTRAKQSARAKCRWNKGNIESRGNAEHAMHSGIATLHMPAEPAETLAETAAGDEEPNYKVLSPCPPVSPLYPPNPLSPTPSLRVRASPMASPIGTPAIPARSGGRRPLQPTGRHSAGCRPKNSPMACAALGSPGSARAPLLSTSRIQQHG